MTTDAFVFYARHTRLAADNLADIGHMRKKSNASDNGSSETRSFRETLAEVRPHPANALSAAADTKPQDGIKIDVDLNNDGIVNVQDLNLQLANWGSKDPQYDHNHDGVMDQKDLDILLSFWGQEGQIMIDNPDVNGDGHVNAVDLGELLANWGSESDPHDINNDGVVDESDLDILLSFWG